MSSRESHLELKVGGFVLLALLGLCFFIASVTDLSFMEKGRGMQVVFAFANGLKEAAPVRLAGVDAGRIKGLKVFVDDADGRKTKVRVFIWIKDGVEIPVDSRVTINQLGLLGEKYVEIMPGLSPEFMKEGTQIKGEDPVPMERITEKVSKLTDKLEATIDGVNNHLLSAKNMQSLEETLADLREVVGNIKQGKGTVGRLFADDSIYKNLDELTLDLKSNPWKLLYRPKQK